MKLTDYRKDYYEFSGKASDVARNLAFAGIAFVWIFKVGAEHGPRIPQELLLPLAFLAICLGADLLQYVAATCVWGIFQWYEESKIDDLKKDPELEAPSWLKWPQFIFFVMKLVTVFLAYIFLAKYVLVIWFQNKG